MIPPLTDNNFGLEAFRKMFPGPLFEDVRSGFYLPVGWSGLMVTLCRQLVDLCPDARCVQVKEKFGALRCYVDGTNEVADSSIQAIEAFSMLVCQDCGTTLRVSTQSTAGWISTRCSRCREELEKWR